VDIFLKLEFTHATIMYMKKSILLWIILVILLIFIPYVAMMPSTIEIEKETTQEAASTNTIPDVSEKTQTLFVTKEGPGDLSIKIPVDIAPYFTDEGVETFLDSKKLTLSISASIYFQAQKLSPNAAEYFITMAEEPFDENSYCGSEAPYSNLTSKKDFLIDGYTFTRIDEQGDRDSGNVITLFNKTNKKTCRYVRFATESVPEELVRALASEDPKTDKKQLELLIKNTKLGKDQFNTISEQLVKTISAK
jgi:biopolymer transport protein ExbD